MPLIAIAKTSPAVFEPEPTTGVMTVEVVLTIKAVRTKIAMMSAEPLFRAVRIRS
jgi:hypothetical protein